MTHLQSGSHKAGWSNLDSLLGKIDTVKVVGQDESGSRLVELVRGGFV